MSMVALVEGSTRGIVVGTVVARVVSVVGVSAGLLVGAAAAGEQNRGKDKNQCENGIFFHVLTSK